jgi:hypothetical protein
MVTAAASTAKPMIWPPTRRVSSGNDADTSATRMGTCDADGDDAGDGDGETCGKARLGSSTGLGSTGSPARENTPGGRFSVGGNTPTPAGAAVAAGVGEGARFALTRTLAEEDAAAAACGEVPLARSVMWVPAALRGTSTAARSWTGLDVRAVAHVVAPGAAQTVKLGASLPGWAVILTFAVPFARPASQTQIA